VVLQQPKPPYLNASTITYTTPSLLHTCSYIATQGPLPTTTVDFWAMVHQLQVPAVVMLTNCAEAGVVKCGQYFPHALHSVRTEGGYEIRVSGKVVVDSVAVGAEGGDLVLGALRLMVGEVAVM
jgi:protein tyrosine phosphatase